MMPKSYQIHRHEVLNPSYSKCWMRKHGGEYTYQNVQSLVPIRNSSTQVTQLYNDVGGAGSDVMCRDTFCWGGDVMTNWTAIVSLKKGHTKYCGQLSCSMVAWLTFDQLSCKFENIGGQCPHTLPFAYPWVQGCNIPLFAKTIDNSFTCQ